jgi:hypothetical protein
LAEAASMDSSRRSHLLLRVNKRVNNPIRLCPSL